MVLKFWNIESGKATHLKYTNRKNESMILKLKVPIEPDRIPISRMNEAFELIIEFVSSIRKFDDSGAINSGKFEVEDRPETRTEGNVEIRTGIKVETTKTEESVEDKPYINIEPWVNVCAYPKTSIDPWIKTKPEIKAETKPEIKAETKPEIKAEISMEDGYDNDNGKEVPKEVSDKLNLLLQEDEVRRDGAQFLINVNTRKGVNNNKSTMTLPVSKSDIVVMPSGDIVGEGKSKTGRKQRYSGYGEAVVKCAPKILEDIASSNDAKVLINASDLAKRMGKEFADIEPLLLYSNVRYKFFDHGLIMKMLSSDDADTCANNGEKVFRFRLRHDHDKLPDSILRQRNELDANEAYK